MDIFKDVLQDRNKYYVVLCYLRGRVQDVCPCLSANSFELLGDWQISELFIFIVFCCPSPPSPILLQKNMKEPCNESEVRCVVLQCARGARGTGRGVTVAAAASTA